MAAAPEDMVEHCNRCIAEMEFGQIGLCDDCQLSASEPDTCNEE